LATALAAPETIKPGDTVWLHAGTYRGGFVSNLRGTEAAPIVVRGERNARVTIDTLARDDQDNGLVMLGGADAIYRDFEVTCSEPTRITKIAGSWPADIRRGGVDIRGDRIKAINLVVHDLGSGFGFWSAGEGGEISGCLIYNNGWRGPDRGHGHGIYAQNARGVKRIADNILFHQFAYGIHVYGSENASLKGFEIDGNIAFGNGCLSGKGESAPGIMVGGGSPAAGIAVTDNVSLDGVRFGYPWGPTNEDLRIANNYFGSGLVVRDFKTAEVTGNMVVAGSTAAALEGAGDLLLAGHRWSSNDYYITDGRWGEFALVARRQSSGVTFDEWRRETSLDADSRFTRGKPSAQRVIVRPSSYDRGRAHIAVLNPEGLPDVEVDLSAVLTGGQKFRIQSVKDHFGPSVAEGVFAGRPVRISMKPVSGPPPVGMPDFETPVTEPEFAAFVLLTPE
jgi:hypothetical protein